MIKLIFCLPFIILDIIIWVLVLIIGLILWINIDDLFFQLFGTKDNAVFTLTYRFWNYERGTN